MTSGLCAGKLGRLWQHVTHVQIFCLAQRKQQKSKDQKPRAMYSRAALRDALKWAAAHAPAQLSLKVNIPNTCYMCMPGRHQLAQESRTQTNSHMPNRAAETQHLHEAFDLQLHTDAVCLTLVMTLLSCIGDMLGLLGRCTAISTGNYETA